MTTQPTAYAGYPFVVGVAVYGSSSPSLLTIEKRSGKSWTKLATVTAGDTNVFVKLPRGNAQHLRATATFGTATVSSDARTVRVVKAAKWQTNRRDDGSYRDPRRPSVRLRIAGGGRKLSGFHADVPTICSSATSPTGTTPDISTIELPTVKLAPDGRFAVSGTYKSVKVRFSGRLKGRKLTGATAVIRTSVCSGSIAVQARRTA